jgi:hypothetical protein
MISPQKKENYIALRLFRNEATNQAGNVTIVDRI